MKTIIRKAKRLLRAAMRGGAAVSVLAKLLIPVGYMPGALADGGPVVLCGAGIPAALAALDASSLSPHHHAEHGGLDGESGHDPESDHGPWERCALGSLASLVPIASDPLVSISTSGAAERVVIDRPALQGRAVGVARARGPPILTA